MEVNLSPDLEGKLARADGRRYVSADVLVREAIERAVDYNDWFIREVDNGLAQIDAGQVLTHDAVGARFEQKVAEHQSRRSWDRTSNARSFRALNDPLSPRSETVLEFELEQPLTEPRGNECEIAFV